MTRQEKLKLLQNWKQCHDNILTLMESLEPAFGSLINSKLSEQLWHNFYILTETTEKFLGSNYNWLEWYCWDNQMGAKRLDAGHGGNMRPIKSLDDLLDLLED